MLPKDKQSIQELIAHPGWEIFQSLILENQNGTRCLKQQLQDSLMSAGRAGDSIKAATYAGQIDILQIVLDVPKKYLEG